MVIKIGEWINNHIDNPTNKGAIVYYGQEDANMELLDISKRNINAYVLSCDNHGNVDWHHITNVTRHDPSQYVYNIKTKWGRNVTVVESKSLLIWNDDKKEFEQTDMANVNIGDKVPLTFNSPNTHSLTHIDVKQYLGKGYVLGKDLNKKFDIISSNIYSRYAKRTSPSIPSEFALNADNGFMIGLYLADGNTHKDYVSIAKNDEHIRSIVREWFDNNGITHRTQIKKENPEVPGLSISTRGYSTIHAEFFDNLLGKHAHGKYVPHEAFLAPDEFVKGLIDGYFSGDGCITDYHVQASSVSQQLIYGISHLLSRYGIFCKISMIQEKPRGKIQNILPRYTLSIQSKYVYKFAQTFSLSMKHKQEKLEMLVSRDTLGNMSYLYGEHNDVMLDSIVSIEKIDSCSHEEYKKVFDITVPDTLNFQIFNGMNCADTSDVGYLQRKLVKAMEDCKVNHDYTVRNACGSIIQFVYGEDGMDPTKIEDQPLPFVKMDYSKLKKTYLLTEVDNLQYILDDDVIENLYAVKDWQKKFETHFQEILEDREFVMKNILASEGGNKIKYPIAFARITNNARAMFNKYDDGTLSDLDPMYALNTINKMCEELYVHEHNKANKFLKMLIRCYLSPKKCIFDYKFNRLAFDYVINQIKQRFYDSIAHPSDMVGVVAAQSLGEPCTQLTLNTFHLSGVASASKAVRGVPRIKELISVSKNMKTPSMNIYLKHDIASDDKKSTEVLNNIQTTLFKDLVKSTKMYYDPDDFETTIEEDKFFVETYRELTNQGLMQKTKLYPWLLRFELDRSALVEHDISMLDIYTVLAEYYEDMVNVMFSDDNSKNLIFRIKIEDTGEDRDIITEMKALERSILENVIIKGLSKISKVVKNQMNVSQYVPSSMTIESEQEWVLETAGTNMLDVLALNEIDPTRTISNDIVEIYELLGVEAARQALYNELHSVIADAGLYVNYRHIALLVDTMTNKGYLLSIDRHGINRTDIGPFAKCSFEETTDMLIKAGIFAEVDRINGVSANTMLGQIPPAGTGDTDVLIDEWKLHDITVEQEDTQQEILQAYENAEELQEEQEMPNLDFDFELPDM